jgi:ATP-dependent RNA helicase RhlE
MKLTFIATTCPNIYAFLACPFLQFSFPGLPLFSVGFILDIKKIIKLLPSKRLNLMFSATFAGNIRQMAKGILENPVEIEVAIRNSAASSVEQLVYSVDKLMKSKLLSHLIREKNWQQVLIFTRTKSGADRLSQTL